METDILKHIIIIFSLDPSDNRITRSTCLMSVFTGTGQSNYYNVFQNICFHWSTLSLITTMNQEISEHILDPYLFSNFIKRHLAWKLTSDSSTFLAELSSAACISVLSKITGYHRSILLGMVITFPGNYCVERMTSFDTNDFMSNF
jgi:hypothetical protein